MIRRHGCLSRPCLIALILSFPIFSQSLEELEGEVLGGGASVRDSNRNEPAPVTEEDYSPSQSPSAPQSDDDDIPLSSGAKKKEVSKSVEKEIDDFITGPKSIPLKHIFVVKHQYIFKTGRHEIVPFTLGIQPGDSFRKQLSMGVGYLYHFTESLAIEALHLNFYTNLESGFSRELFDNVGLEVERIEPVLSVGSAIQWSPFKGKSATAENIYHFEGYLFAGGGFTQFEIGSSPMMMGGLGAKIFLNRHSTLKFEVRDYFDFKSDAGNRFNILVGAGILLGAPEL